MFDRRLIAPLLLVLAVSLPAHAEESAAPVKKPKLEYLYVAVTGVKTDAMAEAAQQQAETVAGVKSFAWTAPRAEAKIVRIVGQAGTPALLAAFAKVGVTAKALVLTQTRFVFQKPLHCNGCVIKVKRALKAVKGTKELAIAKDKHSVTIVYATQKGIMDAYKTALAGTGYPVKPDA